MNSGRNLPALAGERFKISAISHGTYELKKSINGKKEMVNITFDFIERILGAKRGIFMEYLLEMEEKE